jgi:hypothetical protein
MFAISTTGLRVVARASSVAYAETESGGELVHGWAKWGRLCNSAFRCGVLRGALTPDGPVPAAARKTAS